MIMKCRHMGRKTTPLVYMTFLNLICYGCTLMPMDTCAFCSLRVKKSSFGILVLYWRSVQMIIISLDTRIFRDILN